eukprot:TRINITY_DN14043_c0_g1_i5.p1 TRINITY_DN14043_c0_g1~~TRINITY_DN14043_c0_g1_i5.p1  ORF type:complete len:360 (+),score=65.50 TRINITY_DN14043_c0_g1_i5:53-1132(+)
MGYADAVAVTDEHVLKALVMGSAGVGKTHLLSLYAEGRVGQHLRPTVGCEFRSRALRVGVTPVRLQLWDMAGAEENMFGGSKEERRSVYEHSVICALVYDVCDPSSFDALGEWYSELIDPSRMVLLVMASNPSGAAQGAWEVPTDAGEQWAAERGGIFATLAGCKREKETVEGAFQAAAEQVLRRLQAAERRQRRERVKTQPSEHKTRAVGAEVAEPRAAAPEHVAERDRSPLAERVRSPPEGVAAEEPARSPHTEPTVAQSAAPSTPAPAPSAPAPGAAPAPGTAPAPAPGAAPAATPAPAPDTAAVRTSPPTAPDARASRPLPAPADAAPESPRPSPRQELARDSGRPHGKCCCCVQ